MAVETNIAGTATAVAYQLFPYMGDNLMQQFISLLHVKDPLFKRMEASRLARFAIDDKRRMKIVDLGGAQELVNMLGSAKDDQTRKEALKALVCSEFPFCCLGFQTGFLEVAGKGFSIEYENWSTIQFYHHFLSIFLYDAVGALHEAGAIPVIRSTPDSVEYTEIVKY